MNLDLLISFQNIYLNFSDSYVQDVTDFIIKNYNSEDNLTMIVYEILNLYEIRPFNIEKIVELCNSINNLDAFKNKFIKKLLKCSKYIHGPLIRSFYDNKYLTLDQIQKHFEDCPDMCLFYVPELSLTVDDIKKFPQAYEIIRSFDELQDNDWEMYKEMINFGYVQNTIGFGLKYDDPTIMAEFANQGYDLKGYIGPCMFETICGYEFTLINAAAFYGSRDCFKELLLNKINLEEDVCEFAIYGGDSYIIEKCKEKYPKSPYFIRACVRVSRNELLQTYLKEGLVIKFNLYDSLEVHNYFAFNLVTSMKLLTISPGDIQKAIKLAEKTQNLDLFGTMKSMSSLPKLK